MDKPERVILTNMCMIRNGSKVLVEDKVSKWDCGIIFPGGHVEEHEPIVDSVIREMKEETGLTIENPQLCGIKEWINEDGSGTEALHTPAPLFLTCFVSALSGHGSHNNNAQ